MATLVAIAYDDQATAEEARQTVRMPADDEPEEVHESFNV